MLTPKMGGIGQPKQQSWPFEGKRRNCLNKKLYVSYEYEVSLNFDGFRSVYSSGFGYLWFKQRNTTENQISGHFHQFKRFCCQTALTHARDERFRSSLETTCLIVFSSQCESKHTPQVSVETHLVRSQLQSDISGRRVIFSEKMTKYLKRHKHCNNYSNSKFQEPNKTSRFC